MVGYWILVLRRAVGASLDAIGQTTGTLVFAAIVMALGATLLWYRKGVSAMKADIAQTVLEVLGIAVLAWLPFFIWHLIRTPYLLDQKKQEEVIEAKKALEAGQAELKTRRPYLLVEGLASGSFRLIQVPGSEAIQYSSQ
jgi:hypothetical protein